MPTSTIEEPEFRSRAAWLTNEYREEGIDHLKAILAALVESGDQRREFLQLTACQLRVLQVPIADVVRDAARQCPSMSDLRFSCYSRPPYVDKRGNQDNIICWQRSQQRHAERIHRECEGLLRQAGIDSEWINGEIRKQSAHKRAK